MHAIRLVYKTIWANNIYKHRLHRSSAANRNTHFMTPGTCVENYNDFSVIRTVHFPKVMMSLKSSCHSFTWMNFTKHPKRIRHYNCRRKNYLHARIRKTNCIRSNVIRLIKPSPEKILGDPVIPLFASY